MLPLQFSGEWVRFTEVVFFDADMRSGAGNLETESRVSTSRDLLVGDGA